MLRVALEGRSLPVVHGCGWDSGAARERSSALAASVASRYELGADGVGAARPEEERGKLRVTYTSDEANSKGRVYSPPPD